MKHYELLYVIPSKYTEAEVENITAQINNLIQRMGGEVTFTDNLGEMKLAYPIRGAQSGEYVHNGSYAIIEFNLEPAKIKEVDSALKLTPEILRFQIVNKRLKTQAEIEQEKVKKEKIVQGEKLEKSAPTPKISLEELDKKLGEILEGDII